MTDVRLELANEEAADISRGKESLHDVSAAKWLVMGLDLEEQQCVIFAFLCAHILTSLACRRVLAWQSSKKVTTLGVAEIQDKCHALRRRIDAWRDIQQLYMPCTVQLHQTHLAKISALSAAEEPETMPLFLPSSIPSSLWFTGCASGLIDKECRLRLAQADDGLNELRRQLRISATLRDYKKVQVGGRSQKLNTRTRSLMSRFHDKTIRAAERYSAAYKALSSIDPNGEWTTRLKYLDHNKDLRSPRRNDDDESRETRRELSWIWLVSREGGPPKEVASADEINDSKSSQLPFHIMFCCSKTQAWDFGSIA